MNKKNLLFVIPSLDSGGGEKSLINLLSQIDYDSYNVDLVLFHKSGLFLSLVPEQVNVITITGDYSVFKQPLKDSVLEFINHKKFQLAQERLFFAFKNRTIKNKARAEQYSWKYLKPSMDTLQKEYDTAIGYLEKSSIYFIVEKVRSKRKIGWIHTNYANSGLDPRFDQKYFDVLDQVITVSEECANSLKENFPFIEYKVKVIYNIVSPSLIQQLAQTPINDPFLPKSQKTTLITIARLNHEKGIDIAIKACEQLISRGNEIIWYVIGDGTDRSKLEKMIKDKGLEESFKLLGLKENPYPYLKKADIYIQPSRYEGKSIAIDEAKILRKPIIVTNYGSAKDQINNEINGLIVEMKAKGISDAVEKLLQNRDLRQRFISNLSKEQLSTEEEIHKLYAII